MSNLEERFERRPIRTILSLGFSAIGIVALLGMGSCAIGMVANPFHQAARIVNKTIDADNVIANYEWFKRQVQDVNAIDVKVTTAEQAILTFSQSAGPRESWKFDDRQEWSRLNAVLQGLRGQRTQMVAEYNARTSMANRDLFRTSDLPAELH